MNRIKEIVKANLPLIAAMVLGSSLILIEYPLTFGEVCIVSLCFYFYLRLKEMILELSDSITKEKDSQ